MCTWQNFMQSNFLPKLFMLKNGIKDVFVILYIVNLKYDTLRNKVQMTKHHNKSNLLHKILKWITCQEQK